LRSVCGRVAGNELGQLAASQVGQVGVAQGLLGPDQNFQEG
jgi:hypothetical protein